MPSCINTEGFNGITTDGASLHTLQVLCPHLVVTASKAISWQQMHINFSVTASRKLCRKNNIFSMQNR